MDDEVIESAALVGKFLCVVLGTLAAIFIVAAIGMVMIRALMSLGSWLGLEPT